MHHIKANIAIDTPKFISGEMPPSSVSSFAASVVFAAPVLPGVTVQQVAISEYAQCHEAHTLVPTNVESTQTLLVNPFEQGVAGTQQEASLTAGGDNVGLATCPAGHLLGSNVVHGTARVRGSKHIRNTNNDIL